MTCLMLHCGYEFLVSNAGLLFPTGKTDTCWGCSSPGPGELLDEQVLNISPTELTPQWPFPLHSQATCISLICLQLFLLSFLFCFTIPTRVNIRTVFSKKIFAMLHFDSDQIKHALRLVSLCEVWHWPPNRAISVLEPHVKLITKARNIKCLLEKEKKHSEMLISFTVNANILFQTTVCINIYSLSSPTAETAKHAWQMAWFIWKLL